MLPEPEGRRWLRELLVRVLCFAAGAIVVWWISSRENERLRERLKEVYERWHFEWRDR